MNFDCQGQTIQQKFTMLELSSVTDTLKSSTVSEQIDSNCVWKSKNSLFMYLILHEQTMQSDIVKTLDKLMFGIHQEISMST